MPQSYQDLLTALAEGIGLDPALLLATDELIVDDLPINMQLEGEGEKAEVLLCSLLGSILPDRWPEVARSLLLANHLWNGTANATLGVAPNDDTVSLSMRQSLCNLDAEKLATMLCSFTDTGLAWKKYLQESMSIAPPVQNNSTSPA